MSLRNLKLEERLLGKGSDLSIDGGRLCPLVVVRGIGKFEVTTPLNDAEIEYLGKFSETRRMRRHRGPYYVDGGGFAGQEREDNIISFNDPLEGQPGLWCQRISNANGDACRLG